MVNRMSAESTLRGNSFKIENYKMVVFENLDIGLMENRRRLHSQQGVSHTGE